jgi:hypothetical protein
MADSLQPLPVVPFADGSRPKLLDQVRHTIRMRHYSRRTEALRSVDPAIHRLSPQETSFDDGSPGDRGVPVVAGDGATGYRAHYAVGIDFGETFNRSLVDAVAPIVVSSENLYCDHFGKDFCERSLLGPFSKFWFSKELTDPSAQSELLKYREELCVPRWDEYWREQPKPRKGLLAPRPANPTVLLNGTFVSDGGAVYEQKPGRSKQIFDTGWT